MKHAIAVLTHAIEKAQHDYLNYKRSTSYPDQWQAVTAQRLNDLYTALMILQELDKPTGS